MKPFGQPELALVGGEGLERTGEDDAAEVPQHSPDHGGAALRATRAPDRLARRWSAAIPQFTVPGG